MLRLEAWEFVGDLKGGIDRRKSLVDGCQIVDEMVDGAVWAEGWRKERSKESGNLTEKLWGLKRPEIFIRWNMSVAEGRKGENRKVRGYYSHRVG